MNKTFCPTAGMRLLAAILFLAGLMLATAQSLRRIPIQNNDKKNTGTGSSQRGTSMPGKREEVVFLTLEVTSDMPGSFWINDKSYPITKDSTTAIPVPVSFSFYFMSADTLFITKPERIAYLPHQKGTVQLLSLETADDYRQHLLRLSLSATESELKEQIARHMQAIGEDASLKMGMFEVSVAEYAAYMRLLESQEKTARNSACTDSSQVLTPKPTRFVWVFVKGVDWRCDATGEKLPADQYDQPVVNFSWEEAVAFCNWLSSKDPLYKYRLPTAQEWEKAARSGSPYDAPWGLDTVEIANYANTADLSLTTYVNAGKFPQFPDWRLDDRYAFTAPPGSYWPNDGGF